MKQRFLKSILGMAFLLSGLMIGCTSELPSQSDPDLLSLQKKPARLLTAVSLGETEDDSGDSQSETVYYWQSKDGYRGTGIKLANGSSFDLQNLALMPPENWPAGENVIITMSVEKIDNQLIFTFGPSGCTFDPPAEVWLNWQEIGVPVPNLYYIDDNGDLIEEMPDNIFVDEKKMGLFIDHFSRYSVAYSD